MGSIKNVKTSVRTWEIVQDVSGKLEGEFKDWPSQIQDPVYRALERLAKKEQLPLMIVGSYCAYEMDRVRQDGQKGAWYVHIIASEVVKKQSMEGFLQ